MIEEVRKSLPELPKTKAQRFQSQYGLAAYDVKILCADPLLADFFEAAARGYSDYKKLSNWFTGELLRLLNEEGGTISTLKFPASQLAALLASVDKGEISASAGKDVLGEMFRSGKDPAAIIAAKGLGQVSDAAVIENAVNEVIAKNPGEVEKYRAGKKQVFGFFVGQVMKAMKGKGNPGLINDFLKKKLG